MNICEACEQLGNRVKQLNCTQGAIDSLPYTGEMIKSHKHLFFEERRIDGPGCSALLFRCLNCNQCWKLLSWAAGRQFDLRPYFAKHHLSTLEGTFFSK